MAMSVVEQFNIIGLDYDLCDPFSCPCFVSPRILLKRVTAQSYPIEEVRADARRG